MANCDDKTKKYIRGKRETKHSQTSDKTESSGVALLRDGKSVRVGDEKTEYHGWEEGSDLDHSTKAIDGEKYREEGARRARPGQFPTPGVHLAWKREETKGHGDGSSKGHRNGKLSYVRRKGG